MCQNMGEPSSISHLISCYLSILLSRYHTASEISRAGTEAQIAIPQLQCAILNKSLPQAAIPQNKTSNCGPIAVLHSMFTSQIHNTNVGSTMLSHSLFFTDMATLLPFIILPKEPTTCLPLRGTTLLTTDFFFLFNFFICK